MNHLKRALRLLFLHVLAVFGRLFVRRSPSLARVLYIKPDHLGDLLLATPALALLRARAPDAHIAALVGPWSEAVLRRNPDIDTLLTCSFPAFERAAPRVALSFWAQLRAAVRPYRLLLHYAALLRGAGYDTAIIGRDDHWWGAALALLAGIPRRVGFAVPECAPFLTDVLPWEPNAHVAEQGLALVAAATNTPQPSRAESPSTRFDLAEADRAWVAGWRVAQDFAPSDRLVIIHPGTGGPTKLWIAERWSAVADVLRQQSNTRLVLTGGPGEETLVEQVAAGMQARPLVLAGQTTLGQLAALLGAATLVLGVDSGPMHLAAAQGTPTLHLYGPGDDRRFGPWGDPTRHRVLREPLWCSPCGVFAACPRGLAQPECMELIATAKVVTVATAMLGAQSST